MSPFSNSTGLINGDTAFTVAANKELTLNNTKKISQWSLTCTKEKLKN